MKKNKLFKYLFLLSIIILVFGIYTIFKTDKLNYVALGDSLAEGMNPFEAEMAAVKEMGDPVETGVQLDMVHKPKMESIPW